jgi:DNA polymerase I-like protein with 3'-5' exonuclease and polymerase domains
MSEQLIVVKTEEGVLDLVNYIKDKEFISFDTETTGVTEDSEVIGFSVCADPEVAYYVILAYWDVSKPDNAQMTYLPTKNAAKILLQALKGKKLILQNAPFDCAMTFRNFGVELMPSVHTDTLMLGHLLNENRSNGLKERGIELFGEDAVKQQVEMKESVHRNGGVLTKDKYELYKADPDLMAHYGAKDAILTLKVFYHDVEELFEQGLDKFFYDDETMPLLRGPTYDMNTTGLRVDPVKLQNLKMSLETECLKLDGFINKEIAICVRDEYPGTSKATTFNMGSGQQLSWLLFIKLQREFSVLTKEGKLLCKALNMKVPYTKSAKRELISVIEQNKGKVWAEASYNKKTKKMGRPKVIGHPWKYLSCGKESLKKYESRYKWVEAFLKYTKAKKLLTTYVKGIEARARYNIIHPNFLQHGTTSGRYSCKNPNFQNLPREDKRVKECIVAREGKVFVGADYSQLEPRVFASFSGDKRLLECFSTGDDFYSVIGVEVFDKQGLSLKKKDPESFAARYPALRDISKVVGLSSVYGTTAYQMAPAIGKTVKEAQEIMDNLFERFPGIKKLMLDSHKQAVKDGYVTNLFGRPRRMPQARMIPKLFGKTPHSELDYEWRNILNLACNHRIQSTAASIVNRSAIRIHSECAKLGLDAKIVLQVHDSLIVECSSYQAEEVAAIMKECMENTVVLPGVSLEAIPKIGTDLVQV